MLKTDLMNHPKLFSLIKALELEKKSPFLAPKTLAIGMLSRLWDYTNDYIPDGGIGKYPDLIIADVMGWPKSNADELINGLISSGWVDQIEGPARLYVHDWHDHCDQTIHASLARKHKFFANGARPNLSRISKRDRESIVRFYSNHKNQ